MDETAPVKFMIKSNPTSLSIVRSAVERMADLSGFCEDDAQSIALAIDEALANVINHGYQGEPNHPIEVTLLPVAAPDGRAGICAVVRDEGRQVAPESIQGRDLAEVRPGGLGVHIIRSVMDEVEYTCPPEGGMQLRMIKYIPAPPEEGTDTAANQDRGRNDRVMKDGDHE